MPDARELVRRVRTRGTQWGVVIFLGSFLLGVAVLSGGVTPLLPARAIAAEPPAKTAPAFSLPDLQGKRRALSDYLSAKPILLEFMSPDCPHCREMAPILGRLHTVYADRIQFLSVAFDRSVGRIQAFAAIEKHSWPYLLGTQAVVDAYKLEGVPAFCFIAPDGRLIQYAVGSMPEQELRQHLDALLKAR
jgi:thiol-disulfide isomerase/thioredoxin